SLGGPRRDRARQPGRSGQERVPRLEDHRDHDTSGDLSGGSGRYGATPGGTRRAATGRGGAGSRESCAGGGRDSGGSRELYGGSAGMTAAKLLGVDVREVLLSPAHWQAHDWALFTAEVAAVVGVGAVDESLQRDATRRPSKSSRRLANDVRVFGAVGSGVAVGGLFLTGLIAHDKEAEATTVDSLFASGIAAGLISGFLKVTVARSRP